MIYLQRARNKRGSFRLPLLLTVIFLVLAVGIDFVFPVFWRGMAHAVAKPIWQADNVVARHGKTLVAFVRSRRTLIERNNELKQELEKNSILLLDRELLARENEILKQTLDRRVESTSILSAVLVKPPQSSYDTIVVDAGSSLGVVVGAKVYGSENAILGEVVEVHNGTSKIKLYSTAGEKSDVVIERNNISVEAVGQGGGGFEVRVPREVDVVVGDLLVVPGLFQKILGSVVAVETDPKDSFKKVFTRSPINVSVVKWVFIEKR